MPHGDIRVPPIVLVSGAPWSNRTELVACDRKVEEMRYRRQDVDELDEVVGECEEGARRGSLADFDFGLSLRPPFCHSVYSTISPPSRMLQLDTVGLSNDELFSKPEIQYIRRHLKDAEEEMGRIDERRRQLVNNICRYTFAIAPHKWLPEDVIRCIFACFVEDCAIRFPFKRDNRGPAPRQVVLSHVCSTWRRIVLNMKSLWSCITVVPQENFRAFCETWLPQILPRITVDLASSKLSELFWDSFSHFQFKEIEVMMTSAQMAGLPNDVPLKVEGVALAIVEFNHSEHLNLPIFLSRPLHTFKMNDQCGDLDLQMLHLPWAQLRCLDLSGGQLRSMSRVRGLLRQCTSLEVCSLKLYLKPNGKSDDVVPIVALPTLRKLTIHLGGNAKDICAFSHFLLPSLRILEIKGGLWTYDIREVFRKHFNLHQLHELDIEHVKRSPTIVSILKDAPLLRRLSLSPQAMFDEECLRGLGNGHLGRNLELLQLHACSCNADDISKMVEARLKTRKIVSGIAPLFHVQLRCLRGKDESKFLVVKNGMRIELC